MLSLRNFSALAVAGMLTGCSGSSDMTLAERAVERFHQQMNAQQFDAIYDEATEEFQKADSKEQTVNFLRIVNTKLGDTRSAKKVRWDVNFGPWERTVVLGYETQFKEEVAREHFLYRVKGSQARLMSYNVQAKALVTK